MESSISLDNLTEDEQECIWRVLQRDESLRKKQNFKVTQLKGEIHGLRMKGILRDGDDSSRLCVRCHCPLGIIFNKGEICPSCRFKICKTCRVALLTGGWTCIYCFKQMQLKWLSGEWIHPRVQAPNRNRRLSGSDIVRSAFSNPESSGNAGKAVTEEIRRAITNGSGPPSSEDLERTSSFESSSIGASTLHDAEVERVGFPSESDSFRLSRLIGSYTNKTPTEKREHICIKRASSRPYRDSDSDSSSSTPTSPVLSAGRKSLARSTPSLNTAMTPEQGRKKDQQSTFKSTTENRRSQSPGSDFALARQISNSSGQSLSPSELPENGQGERRTSTRSGTLSNANSKSRLLDLASYHLTSSKKNLSVSTDSGQAPLSLQADTGSELELYEQSQSSGSRTKLSSDASDNEIPIDSYFTDHLSKEENRQARLAEDVFCSDPVYLHPQTEDFTLKEDESGNPFISKPDITNFGDLETMADSKTTMVDLGIDPGKFEDQAQHIDEHKDPNFLTQPDIVNSEHQKMYKTQDPIENMTDPPRMEVQIKNEDQTQHIDEFENPNFAISLPDHQKIIKTEEVHKTIMDLKNTAFEPRFEHGDQTQGITDFDNFNYLPKPDGIEVNSEQHKAIEAEGFSEAMAGLKKTAVEPRFVQEHCEDQTQLGSVQSEYYKATKDTEFQDNVADPNIIEVVTRFYPDQKQNISEFETPNVLPQHDILNPEYQETNITHENLELNTIRDSVDDRLGIIDLPVEPHKTMTDHKMTAVETIFDPGESKDQTKYIEVENLDFCPQPDIINSEHQRTIQTDDSFRNMADLMKTGVDPDQCEQIENLDKLENNTFLFKPELVQSENNKAVSTQDISETMSDLKKTAFEPRFDLDQCEDQMNHNLTSTSENKEKLSPESNKLDLDQRNSENWLQNKNQELSKLSDSVDDLLGIIDLRDNPNYESNIITDTGTLDDQSEMIGIFEIDRKECFDVPSKISVKYKNCESEMSQEFSECEIKVNSLKDSKVDSSPHVGSPDFDHSKGLFALTHPEAEADPLMEEEPIFNVKEVIFNLDKSDVSLENHHNSSGEYGCSSTREDDVCQSNSVSVGQLGTGSELELLDQLPVMHEQPTDICNVLSSAPEQEICSSDPLATTVVSEEETHLMPSDMQFGKSEEQALLSASYKKDLYLADPPLSLFQDVSETGHLLSQSENETYVSSFKQGDNNTADCLRDRSAKHLQRNEPADFKLPLSGSLESEPEDLTSNVHKMKDSIVEPHSKSVKQDSDNIDHLPKTVEMRTQDSVYFSSAAQQVTGNFMNTSDPSLARVEDRESKSSHHFEEKNIHELENLNFPSQSDTANSEHQKIGKSQELLKIMTDAQKTIVDPQIDPGKNEQHLKPGDCVDPNNFESSDQLGIESGLSENEMKANSFFDGEASFSYNECPKEPEQSNSFPGPSEDSSDNKCTDILNKIKANEEFSDLYLSNSSNNVSGIDDEQSVEIEESASIHSLDSHMLDVTCSGEESALDESFDLLSASPTFLKKSLHDTSFTEGEFEDSEDFKSFREENLLQNKDFIPQDLLPTSHQEIPETEDSVESSNTNISLEDKISEDFCSTEDCELQCTDFAAKNSEYMNISKKEQFICNTQLEAGTENSVAYSRNDSSVEYSMSPKVICQDKNEEGIGSSNQFTKLDENSEEEEESISDVKAPNNQVLPQNKSSMNTIKKPDQFNVIGFQPDLTESTLPGSMEGGVLTDLVSGASSIFRHNNGSISEQQSEDTNVYLGQDSDSFEFRIQPQSKKMDIFFGDSELESDSGDVEILKPDVSFLPEEIQSSNEINKEKSEETAVLSFPDEEIEKSVLLSVTHHSQIPTPVNEGKCIDFPAVKLGEESLEILADQTRTGKASNEIEGRIYFEKDLEGLQEGKTFNQVESDSRIDSKMPIKEDLSSSEDEVHPIDTCQTESSLSPEQAKGIFSEHLLHDEPVSVDEQHVQCQDLNVEDPYMPLFNDALDFKKVYLGSEDLSPDSDKLEIHENTDGNTCGNQSNYEFDPSFEFDPTNELDLSNELDPTNDDSDFADDSGNSDTDDYRIMDPISDGYLPKSFFPEANPLDEIYHSREEPDFRQEFSSQVPNSSLFSHSRHFLEAIPEQVFEDSNEEEPEMVCLAEPTDAPANPQPRTDSLHPGSFESQNNQTDDDIYDIGFKRVTFTILKDEDIDEEFWSRSTFPISPTTFSRNTTQSLPEINNRMYSSKCLETDIDSVLDLQPQNISRPCQLDIGEPDNSLDLKEDPVDIKSPCESGSSEFSLLEYSPGSVPTALSFDSDISPMSPIKDHTPFGSLHDMILNDERLAYERMLQCFPSKNKTVPEPDHHQKSSESCNNLAKKQPFQYKDDRSFGIGNKDEPTETVAACPEFGNSISLDPSPVIHLRKPDPIIPHKPKTPSHSFIITDKPSPLDALPRLSKEKTDPHCLGHQPSNYPAGEGQKVVSQKSHEDALTDVSQSRTFSGGGGGGPRDDNISDTSSLQTNPDHWLNGNRRKADLDASSLPSITISEAEGSVSVRDESEEEEEENRDLLKGSQSFRSGQSMTSSIGLSSSMGSRDSLSSYYSNAGEVNYGKINVTGDIQFGLDYDYKTVCLEIRIKQCRDLAPADMKKSRSDPYVKSYLLPDKSKTGKRKTKVKKNTLNPVFDEILRYSIAKSELENRTLWLTVWHNDRFGRNDFLGEVTIPFDYYRFEGSTLKWYSLQQRQEFTPSSLAYKGELSISLKFITVDDVLTGSTTSLKHSRGESRSPEAGSNGQLHVYIKDARNLTAVRSGGYSDPFCKGYLLPEKNRSSKQKTPVVKKNCNPVWNHLFVFEDVSVHELSDRCLELTLWDYDRLSSNDFLGGIRLNLGSGVCGRKYVDWMDASGAEVSLWQSMLSSPNNWADGTLILRANMNNTK